MPTTRIDAAATLPGEDFSRVALTPDAVDLLRKLWEQHGPLMFHQSGGCCDGSSPMCYPAGEFITGDSDVLLGLFDIADAVLPQTVEFWMSREQFNYWSHTHLTVDVVPAAPSGLVATAGDKPLGRAGGRFLRRAACVRAGWAVSICGIKMAVHWMDTSMDRSVSAKLSRLWNFL